MEDQEARRERTDRLGAIGAAPDLARMAASGWMRTAAWSATNTVRAGRRLAGALIGRASASELIRDAQLELDRATRALARLAQAQVPGTEGAGNADGELRRRGTALLERSSELTEAGPAHPAYARILEELAPDEARILRLLATDGPRAAVDVRTWRPLDVGSTIVAPGLSMIAQHAGCMHPDRVPAYLSNLFRLGLIWFSRESLPDPDPYQVLEAQPDVVEAVRSAGRARIVRRSIHLTPFGRHFCDYCLPLDTAEFEALGR